MLCPIWQILLRTVYFQIYPLAVFIKELSGFGIKNRVIQQLNNLRSIPAAFSGPQFAHQPFIVFGRGIAASHVIRSCIQCVHHCNNIRNPADTGSTVFLQIRITSSHRYDGGNKQPAPYLPSSDPQAAYNQRRDAI